MATPPDRRSRAALLAERGYSVDVRAGEWHECVIARDDEAFVGRGRDADAAFDAALGRLLGSALARELFDEACARRDGSEQPSAEVASPTAPPTASAPAPTRTPPAVAARPVPRAEPAPPAAAMAVLDELAAHVDAADPEILLDAPEAIRLQMAVLLARARAEQERARHPAIEERVTHLAARLAQWSRTAWPGDVPLLKLETGPKDAARWLGAARAETWDDVAALAAGRLAALDLSDGGWRDAAACEPPPASPAWSLAHARHLIEKRLGAGVAPKDPAAVQAADRWRDHEKTIDGFERAARELRWVRPVTPDVRAWASAIGLLRWIAQHWRLAPKHRLVVALDPATAPRPGWGHVLGRDPVTLERKRRQRALLSTRPSRATAHDALLAWFASAAEVFDGPELAVVCAEVADRLLALDPTAAFPSGRARDRLKVVQKRLGAAPAAPVATEAPFVDELDVDVPDVQEPTPLERARAVVAGKSALVVGNREDPHLSRRYADDLGLVTTWCDASQGARTVDAAVERIAQRAFDLVLCHTGFVSHATDGKVKRACRDAGVRYVPAYKGRVQRTALALIEPVDAAAT